MPARNGPLALCTEVLIPLCQLRKKESQRQHSNRERMEVNQDRSHKGALKDTSSFSIMVDSSDGPLKRRYTNYKGARGGFRERRGITGSIEIDHWEGC